jgi:hypothetical protein
MVGEIIEQRAGNRRLANTAFVCADQHDCGLCHNALPIHSQCNRKASANQQYKSARTKAKAAALRKSPDRANSVGKT